MEEVMELFGGTNPITPDATLKRKRNFGTKCTGHHEEPFTQFLVVDHEDQPSKKKVENAVTQQQITVVNETGAAEDVVHHSHYDQSVNNKPNSPIRFVPSPGSDSNSTIPLEIEETGNVVPEVIALVAIPESIDREYVATISCNPVASESPKKKTLLVSEEALDLSSNAADTAKPLPVVPEPPGNFAFINLGFAPSSLCSDRTDQNIAATPTFSAHEGVTVDQTSLLHRKNRESSCAALNEEKIDLINYSSPPPVLSLCSDNRETCPILPSSSEAAANELTAVPGICPIADQGFAILPEDTTVECMPRLFLSPSHVFDHDSSSHFSAAIKDREEYIPLNVGIDELEKKELELRKAACKTKDLLAPIIAASKRLEDERELLKSKLTELHADMTVRDEVINSLNQTSAINKEKIERNLAERNRQHALSVEIKIRLVKKELAMRELQVAICQEKLLAVSSDTPVDSLSSAIAANQQKVVAINADIYQCYDEEKAAKEMLMLLNEQIKKDNEEDQSLRRRIENLDLQQRKAEALVSENEESLQDATLKLKQLIKQRKNHSAYFVNLERMMVKIKMCRKLKELDRKEERIIGKELPMQRNRYADKVRSTSNVQYASQLTVFGRSYQPTTSEEPSISRSSSSVQHFTSLQSIAIHNHASWLPQNFLPLPRFSPGLLQISPLALPWVGPQDP